MENYPSTWQKHTLTYDKMKRRHSISYLDDIKDDTQIFLVQPSNDSSNDRWYIATDKTHCIEFDITNGLDSACVIIEKLSDKDQDLSFEEQQNKMVPMDKEVRKRILHVLGFNDFSIHLRNCEHVARYIFDGEWNSSDDYITELKKKNPYSTFNRKPPQHLVNKFPSCVQPSLTTNDNAKLYEFIDSHYEAENFHFFLDGANTHHKCLIVGPPGAGKTNLVNVIFNKTICELGYSLRSSKQDVYFVEGKNKKKPEDESFVLIHVDMYGLNRIQQKSKARPINEQLISRIADERIDINSVVIVFRADARLGMDEVDGIKKVLECLDYKKNFENIHFVATFADALGIQLKGEIQAQAQRILVDLIRQNGLTDETENDKIPDIICTGFPKDHGLNEEKFKFVKDSWTELTKILEGSNGDVISLNLENSSGRAPDCAIL